MHYIQVIEIIVIMCPYRAMLMVHPKVGVNYILYPFNDGEYILLATLYD